MPYKFPLKVEFDVPEPRIDAGRLVAAVDGTSWDNELLPEDGFICPQTGTFMLRPLPLSSAWANTFTGKYARFPKADFLFPEYTTQSLDWDQISMRSQLDYWLMGSGFNYPIYINKILGPNQPMHVQLFVPGFATSDTFLAFEFGWNRNQSDELSFRLYGNGKLDLVKGGVRVNQFERKSNDTETKWGYETNQSYKNAFVSFTIIPFRTREVLIITDKGQSFLHTFDDLPQDGTNNIIFPPGIFYAYSPTGRPAIQIAPCYFAQSAIAYSQPIEFRYAPSAAEFSTYAYRIYSGLVGYAIDNSPAVSLSIVDADTLSAFVPDGYKRHVRLKITLTSNTDQTGSLGIYMAEAYNDPTVVNTYSGAVDVTTAIESLVINVDENGRTTCTLSARKANLETLGINRPEVITNRTFRVALENNTGDIDLIRGTLNAPAITYHRATGDLSADYAILTYQGQDRMGTIDHAALAGPVYDGFDPNDAVLDVLKQAGFGSDAILPHGFGGFIIPFNPKISMGEYSVMPERGDTAGKMLDRIRTDYAATWQMGWVPSTTGYKFAFYDMNALSTTPEADLYMETSDAYAANSNNMDAAVGRIIRELSEHYEPPEANQVIVVGQDPMTRLLIYGNYNDFQSQDALLAPSARPENWLGEVRTFWFSDPTLTTQEAVGKSGLILAQRLMPGRHLVQFESDLLVAYSNSRPLWIGDCIRIYNEDGSVKGKYRILSVPNIVFIREDATNNVFHRKANYTCMLIKETSHDFSNSDNSGYWFL